MGRDLDNGNLSWILDDRQIVYSQKERSSQQAEWRNYLQKID